MYGRLTRRCVLLVLIAVSTLGGADRSRALSQSSPEPRLPRDKLLVYREADGAVQPVRSVEDWLPEKGWTQTRYMPKLADYRGRLAEIPFDFHELIGSLAPRHVLIIAPVNDHNFRADSVDRIAAAARPIFELYGDPQRLRVEHPDCAHDFPPEMREAAFELFNAVLQGD